MPYIQSVYRFAQPPIVTETDRIIQLSMHISHTLGPQAI